MGTVVLGAPATGTSTGGAGALPALDRVAAPPMPQPEAATMVAPSIEAPAVALSSRAVPGSLNRTSHMIRPEERATMVTAQRMTQ